MTLPACCSDVSNSSAALLDVEKLAAMIVAEVSNTMHVQRAAIFVKDQAGGYQMVASEGTIDPKRWGLQADNPIRCLHGAPSGSVLGSEPRPRAHGACASFGGADAVGRTKARATCADRR